MVAVLKRVAAPPSEAEKPKPPDRAAILEATTEEARSRGTLDTAAEAAAAGAAAALPVATRSHPRRMQLMESQLLSLLEQQAPGARLRRGYDQLRMCLAILEKVH